MSMATSFVVTRSPGFTPCSYKSQRRSTLSLRARLFREQHLLPLAVVDLHELDNLGERLVVLRRAVQFHDLVRRRG